MKETVATLLPFCKDPRAVEWPKLIVYLLFCRRFAGDKVALTKNTSQRQFESFLNIRYLDVQTSTHLTMMLNYSVLKREC